MANKKTNQHFFKRLKHKYRFIIYNDNTYAEVISVRLTKLNVFSIIGTSVILIIGIVVFLVVFTPVRELIPGYPDGNMRRELVMNAILLDSIENELRIRTQFLENVTDILSGREPRSLEYTPDTNIRVEDINFARSYNDSLLRLHIQGEEQFTLDPSQNRFLSANPLATHFISPTTGMIINRFNPAHNHFGVDMVTEAGQPVLAVSGGTVTFANWTVDTGYVIQIQHENNFLSLYKHNAELLKKVGEVVTAGEIIAIVGNSGELTTGPHLHFELWQNGAPLNPENYIVF